MKAGRRAAVRFRDARVAQIFRQYPPELRRRLMLLRRLIFDTAARTPGVGEIEETLKWGEPAYLTSATGAGSTIRIDRKKANDRQYAMYFHCRTGLVDMFRALFPGRFTFEGNRAIVFEADEDVPVRELQLCIEASLTYHLRKNATLES